jgi:hypothetical protein
MELWTGIIGISKLIGPHHNQVMSSSYDDYMKEYHKIYRQRECLEHGYQKQVLTNIPVKQTFVRESD